MAIEVCHNIAPFMQPKPDRNQGGDCFACALTAALRHLYPERPVTFDAAWEYFMVESVGGGRMLSNTWPGMRRALYNAHADGYRLEIANDLVLPDFNVDHHSYPWWQSLPTTAYARRLEGYLRGVAFTEIRFDGSGPRTPQGEIRATDHFVALDGLRMGWEPIGEAGRVMRYHVHVVCSAKGAYWIGLDEFLLGYGGAGWWLCRRDER
jgi:hypothetical protein